MFNDEALLMSRSSLRWGGLLLYTTSLLYELYNLLLLVKGRCARDLDPGLLYALIKAEVSQ